MPRRLFLVFLTWAALLGSTRAHEPFLSEIETSLDSSGLILRVVMARSLAAHLAGLTTGPRLYFPAAQFSAHKADFTRVATGLCALSANGVPLKIERVDVALSGEDDEVLFTLFYPRPATAKIRVECHWLPKLSEEGYSAVIHPRGNKSSRDSTLLTSQNSAGESVLPPVEAAPSWWTSRPQ